MNHDKQFRKLKETYQRMEEKEVLDPQQVLQAVEDLLDEMPLDYALEKVGKQFGMTFPEIQDYLEKHFQFYSGI